MAVHESMRRKSTLLSFLLLIPFLFYNLRLASASSGGVMGGQFFDSSSSSLSSSSSSSSSSDIDHYSRASDTFRNNDRYQNNNVVAGGNKEGSGSIVFLCIFVGAVGVTFAVAHYRSERSSVIKLQVGLNGKAKSLQTKVNEIALTADTTNVKGLHYILTETTLSLLRHLDYCISAYSCADQKLNIAGAEKCFNQLLVEEREKFDIETLVNVNNVKIRRACAPKSERPSKDYIVVTILVAARGSHKIANITNSDGLRDALAYLCSIVSRKTLAVEVLWTPQNDSDTLSEEELLEDYPLLRPILT